MYGKPHENSDIDMVLYMPDSLQVMKLAELLTAESVKVDEQLTFMQREMGGYGGTGCITLRSGRLNLLVCYNERAYKAWQEGTQRLVSKAAASGEGYCTREEAIAVFDEERDYRNLPKRKGGNATS